jgi:uncharacterized membrane protein
VLVESDSTTLWSRADTHLHARSLDSQTILILIIVIVAMVAVAVAVARNDQHSDRIRRYQDAT